MSEIGFSIIIPTYNHVFHLKKCIDSIFNLHYQNFELIVVNDNSSDETDKYLSSINHPKVKIIKNDKNIGPALSRNRGVAIANYDFIAFTDDDCLVDSNWLVNLQLGFIKHKTDMVIGQTFYINRGYQGYFPERLVKNINADWPMTCNIAYRKKIFKNLGGFSDQYCIFHNEDTELAVRLVSKGLLYQRVIKAVVCHQKINWTIKSLLASANNGSVWVSLKKRYPHHYLVFGGPVKWGMIVCPQEYLYIILLPIIIPLLLIRYIYHGQKDIKIFFIKWPVYILLKRFYIIRESYKNRVFMV